MSKPAAIAPEGRSPTPPIPPESTTTTPPRITEGAVLRRRHWDWMALGVALLATLIVLFGFNPAHHGFYPFCVFHRLTGLQCPGCGGLRAAHHLLHGEVMTAFRFNPLFVLAVPFAMWMGVRRLVRGPRAVPVSPGVQTRWGWAAFVILLVFWIVRNLPLEIFKLPTE
jgi:hypothetical protein